MSGWGSSGWGGGEWGASGGELQLARVVAVRENVVRFYFSKAPRFTGVLDPHDASNPARYQITPVPGAIGGDGRPTRPVVPVQAEQAPVAGSAGTQIDVTLDRPMSPYPARYFAAVNQLVSDSDDLLDPNFSMAEFPALFHFVPPPARDTAIPSRDIANPQTLEGLLDPVPTIAGDLLGTIPVDDNGDYAFDEGVTNLKKRIYRRLLTSPGAFAGLPDYGVGVPKKLKLLGNAAVRNALAAEAQKQIAQEPDVLGVRVSAVSDPSTPALTRFRIRVRTKFSTTPIDVDVPFSPTE